MAQKDNTAMQYVYVPGRGLAQVSREEADKILAPVLTKQAERKAKKEAGRKTKKFKEKK